MQSHRKMQTSAQEQNELLNRLSQKHRQEMDAKPSMQSTCYLLFLHKDDANGTYTTNAAIDLFL